MENLSDNLLKIFDRFSTKPIEFAGFMILMTVVYFIYVNVDKLMDLIPTPEYESSQFQASLKRDSQINQSLEDARMFYEADGVVIGQFHNGQYDLTRLPFTKVSITYYEGLLDDDNVSEVYTERPISSMNNIMLDMWKDKENPRCIAKEVSRLKDPSYRLRMTGIGIQYITLCPLTNIRNYPIGYLSVGFEEIPSPQKIQMVLDYQRVLASRIAGYLQEGAVREKDD